MSLKKGIAGAEPTRNIYKAYEKNVWKKEWSKEGLQNLEKEISLMKMKADQDV